MLLELKRLTVPPGQRVILQDVTWAEFEQILVDLGEPRAARIAYHQGILEIMTPLPEHEKAKLYITNFVEIILEELDIDFVPLGSTTFKNKAMSQGIEPDNCFYIQNEAAVRQKDRLDLATDPPPDLALEVDVTSPTNREIYEGLKVPELWQFNRGKLTIYLLQDNGKYVESTQSAIFPNLPVVDVIPLYLERAKIEGRNQTMRAFRAWVSSETGFLA